MNDVQITLSNYIAASLAANGPWRGAVGRGLRA